LGERSFIDDFFFSEWYWMSSPPQFFEISPRSLKTILRREQLVISDLFLYPNECKAYTLTEEHKAKQSQKKKKKERKKERREKARKQASTAKQPHDRRQRQVKTIEKYELIP